MVVGVHRGRHLLIDCSRVPRSVCLDDQAMLDAMHAAAIMPLRFASFIYSKCTEVQPAPSASSFRASFFEVSKHGLCTDTFDFALHSEAFVQAATNPVRACI